MHPKPQRPRVQEPAPCFDPRRTARANAMGKLDIDCLPWGSRGFVRPSRKTGRVPRVFGKVIARKGLAPAIEIARREGKKLRIAAEVKRVWTGHDRGDGLRNTCDRYRHGSVPEIQEDGRDRRRKHQTADWASGDCGLSLNDREREAGTDFVTGSGRAGEALIQQEFGGCERRKVGFRIAVGFDAAFEIADPAS
jgi:hypothetical protein